MPATRWILVAGSSKALSPEVEATARLLGRALAQAGFGLVTCGWPGVDREVGTAYVEAAGDTGGSFRQFRRLGLPPSVEGGEVIVVGGDAEEYLAAVEAADAVVLISGLGGTALIHRHAGLVNKAVLPLPRTGGDAKTIFEELRQGLDKERYLGISSAEFEALDQPSEQAVGMALRMLRKHFEDQDVRDGQYLTEQSVVGRDNEAAFARLVDEVQQASVMAFVGAGISIPGGYPDWGTLVDRMSHALPDQVFRAMAYVSREEDLLMRAQQYRKLLGPDAYKAFIHDQFGDEQGTPTALHEDIVRLPVPHILTTNYDTLLERAHAKAFPGDLPKQVSWDDDAKIDRFIRVIRRRAERRRYVHLHGIYDRPENIVLTESDYHRRYHHTTAGEALLSVLFTAHAFLFMGFSFSDETMMGVFRGTMARLRLGKPMHFAFVALEPRTQDPTLVRQRLNTKFKIDPIFYLLTPDHAGLHQLVRRLRDASRREHQPPGHAPATRA